MQPKKIWANLGVKDVEKTRAFYTALGFTSNEGHNKTAELASFKIGENGFVVHFFDREKLKESIKAEPVNANEVIFTLWADSVEEADDWAEEVRRAGGTLFTQPEAFGNNYYGFGFSDPDGHKWNVFHM